jgi:hypothetical protein
MKKTEKSAIRGLLIGDSHLRKRGNYFELGIAHSIKQKDYLKYKADFLSEAFGKDIKLKEYNTNGYECVRISTSHHYLKYCYNWLYKPQKKLTLRYLRKISNEGVAFWYMDDGSLYAKKRNGKVHAYELVISTYVSKTEAEDVILFFKERFDVDFTLKFNKGKYSVRCGTKAAKKFLSQIEKYIPECMEYKTFCNKEKLVFIK